MYLYLLFESVLNFVRVFFFFFLPSWKHISFYKKLLYKMRYFVYNVMCGCNLFLVLLTNGSSSIHFEWLNKQVDISKFSFILEK